MEDEVDDGVASKPINVESDEDEDDDEVDYDDDQFADTAGDQDDGKVNAGATFAMPVKNKQQIVDDDDDDDYLDDEDQFSGQDPNRQSKTSKNDTR